MGRSSRKLKDNNMDEEGDKIMEEVEAKSPKAKRSRSNKATPKRKNSPRKLKKGTKKRSLGKEVKDHLGVSPDEEYIEEGEIDEVEVTRAIFEEDGNVIDMETQGQDTEFMSDSDEEEATSSNNNVTMVNTGKLSKSYKKGKTMDENEDMPPLMEESKR